MVLILDNLFERMLNQFGLNEIERPLITILFVALVFLIRFYTFPKKSKRTLDIVSRKTIVVLWGVIAISIILLIFAHQYPVISLSAELVLWLIYFTFYGKEVWSGLSKMKYNYTHSDSTVLLISVLFVSVLILMSCLFLTVNLLGIK